MTELSQAYAPNQLSDRERSDFFRYMEMNNIDQSNMYAVQMAWGRFSADMLGTNYYSRNMIVGPYSSSNKLYDSGPFTWRDEDIISDVTTAGSPIMQWMPTTDGYRTKYQPVSHLEAIAPAGFDGTDYFAFLAGQDIAECEYGPGTKFNTFQYEVTGGEFSVSTDTFKINPSFALSQDYERSPHFRVRGPNQGLPLDNDVDFGTAAAALHAQRHLNIVMLYGDETNSDLEWDGLDTILTSGYVSARLISGSGGSANFADPVIRSASSFATIGTFVEELREMIRYLRTRFSLRQLDVADGDQVICMCRPAWNAVAEYLATHSYVTSYISSSSSVITTPADADARLERLLTGGMGYGAFNVDGRPVPVLIDDNLDTATGTSTTSVSDVYVLTRRIGGEVILEQQFLNYEDALRRYPIQNSWSTDSALGLGGIMRYGWVQENAKCVYYFAEMAGRMVSRAQPYQGRFTSLTVPLNSAYPVESNTYTDNFWATVAAGGTLWDGV